MKKKNNNGKILGIIIIVVFIIALGYYNLNSIERTDTTPKEVQQKSPEIIVETNNNVQTNSSAEQFLEGQLIQTIGGLLPIFLGMAVLAVVAGMIGNLNRV